MAYGSPNKEEDVLPYYTDIRRGREPSKEDLDELIERYYQVGALNGPSVLLTVSKKQAKLLGESLGDDYKIYLGMRHWQPWIRDVISEMHKDGIEEAIALVLAPHFSTMSVAAYQGLVNKALEDQGVNIKFKFVNQWHLESNYLQALEELCLESFQKSNFSKEHTHVFFTAHSLPQRILQNGDTYKDSLYETSEALAKRLELPNWSLAFQSEGKTQGPWLGPDVCDAIKDKKDEGVDNILVCCIGFLVDHLEVKFDLDIEAKETAEKLNLGFYRVPSLNTNPQLIEALKTLVLN